MAKSTIKGTIKWFNPRKRFGYISYGQGQEIFIHINQWQGSPGSWPQEGQQVKFHIGEFKGRAEAQNVRPVDAEGLHQFLNPYNFVRYLDKPTPEPTDDSPERLLMWRCSPPPHDRYVGLTGRITCTVEAKTSLFISDSHAVEEDEEHEGHKIYRFFKVKNEDGELEPALPASSLRGMVRSVFEAVTNSCFAVFDGGRKLEHRKPPEYARSLEPGIVQSLPTQGGPGVIQLYDFAKVGAYYRGCKKNRNILNPDEWQCGEKVWARITKVHTPMARVWQLAETEGGIRETTPKSQTVEGFLKITGKNISRKNNEYFFYGDKETVTCSNDAMREYNEVLRGQIEDGRLETYQHQSLTPGDLVWVKTENGEATQICNVRVPRVQYKYPLRSFLDEFPHLFRCDEFSTLCPACRVFGWVWDSPPEDADRVAYAGRVQLSHGTLTHSEGTLPETTLAILSTPKPTTTEFYLLDSEGTPDFDVDYDDETVRLRGRKFYRHHGEVSRQEYTRAPMDDPKKDNQNRTVRDALKPGATFTFTVDFENLAPVELGALLYALELEDDLVHRLGYAKPLGFGSVRVMVDEVETVNWRERIASLSAEAGWQEGDREKVDDLKKDFLQTMRDLYGEEFDAKVLADLHALLGEPPEDLPVHYPRPSEEPRADGENYEWFVGNEERAKNKHKPKNKRKNLPEPVTLDLASEDVQGLPLINKDGNEVR